MNDNVEVFYTRGLYNTILSLQTRLLEPLSDMGRCKVIFETDCSVQVCGTGIISPARFPEACVSFVLAERFVYLQKLCLNKQWKSDSESIVHSSDNSFGHAPLLKWQW
jgi:hypothetical protein